jgi:gamma-glutamyltranspeptidase/glutathione hydrolase
MKDGKPFMGLSTPGADQQIQILLQVLLNVIEWNMPVEHAVDQPRFGSMNFPETGARGGEYNDNPGSIAIESRVGKSVIERLTQMGHKVQSWGLWNHRTGSPTVTYRDPKTGLLVGAADVRREGTALGY